MFRLMALSLLSVALFTSPPDVYAAQKKPTVAEKLKTCSKRYFSCQVVCGDKYDSADLNALNTCLERCHSRATRCEKRAQALIVPLDDSDAPDEPTLLAPE